MANNKSKKQKLEWHNEKWRLKDILPSDNNPNTNTPVQFSNLTKSIKRDGYVETIVIDIDGRTVAGEHRRKAMMEMGMAETEIDVRVPNRKMSEEEFNRYRIASNALHGTWDFEKLKAFDPSMLLDLGMDEQTLGTLWDNVLQTEDDGFQVEKEIAKIKKPKSKLGEVYTLGKHKLIVGDATDPKVLEKLFGSEKASVIYSDPIYNLNFPYRKGLGGRQDYGADVMDKRSAKEYREFLKKSMEAALAVTKDDAHIFYYNDQSQIGVVQSLFEELGLKNRRVAIWLKNFSFPTPGIAFSKTYEPCIYSTRGRPYIAKGMDNLNEILNREIGTGNRLIDDILDQLDIWLVKRLAGNLYTHSTEKPVILHEKAIRRCSRPGDIILDSFSGSGSTLMACEQLKRRAYVVELEPLFADLTILRYEKSSNQKAKRIN